MFSDRLFSEEELADTAVSVHREVPMLPWRRFADVGVAVIPPVADRTVRRTINRSVGWNNMMDKVSVLSWPVCDPPIRIAYAGLVSGGPLLRSSGLFDVWCLSTGAGQYAGLSVPHDFV